ncbi:hypothetical protein EON80_04195 [bacterium]|nr:MAG: hypothetical protein EON80_04195 [bacterium]
MSFILGVDFSGAALAGEKIWVSRAQMQNNILHFDVLERAANLAGGTTSRDDALVALRTWLNDHPGARCGFDFPFSLRREAITDSTYADWLKRFADRFPTPEELRDNNPDSKRLTDIEAKTPFSPLNLRLYRQTYYGIRDILAPLHAAGAQILPFDSPTETKTWLLEICPASLLKREKLYLSYKGKSEIQRQNRETIISEMSSRVPFTWSDELAERAVADTEGDALDAVLAAVCVLNALKNPSDLTAKNEVEKFEGRVYF